MDDWMNQESAFAKEMMPEHLSGANQMKPIKITV